MCVPLLSLGSQLSCGLDEGKVYVFDARVQMTRPAVFIETRKEDLFTHQRYNEFMFLLGYGDGELRHIDLRQPKSVSVRRSCSELCCRPSCGLVMHSYVLRMLHCR